MPPPLTARSNMPSARVRVWPNSGWLGTVIVPPGSGEPSRLSSLPRNTAACCTWIVSGATPVWTRLVPVYRKALADARLVMTFWSTGGAIVLGSGGSTVVGLGVRVAVAVSVGVGVGVEDGGAMGWGPNWPKFVRIME